MPRKKRKVGFFYLTVTEGNVQQYFATIVRFIHRLSKVERRTDLGSNKFCLLDTLNSYQDGHKRIVFKCATHSYRPNLIHSQTINERTSPKNRHEGEIEKTHIVTKNIDNDVVLIFERHMDGMTINQFIRYLNKYCFHIPREEGVRTVTFGYEVVVKDNFLEEIANLSRVTCAEIFVDKQMLGSDALNYSRRTSSVKHEVMLSVKAKNRDSIEDFARDIYAKLNGGRNMIKKIRLIGRNEDNNEVIINTDFIERQEYITPEVNNDTGEIASENMFQEMEIILQNF